MWQIANVYWVHLNRMTWYVDISVHGGAQIFQSSLRFPCHHVVLRKISGNIPINIPSSWRCLCNADNREKKLLICCAVLHSSGSNDSWPFSFVLNFISLDTFTGSAFCPLVTPASNLSTKYSFTFSLNLVDFLVVLRAHPFGRTSIGSVDSDSSWRAALVSRWSWEAVVMSVTLSDHFFLMVSYNDSDSSCLTCFPVSICVSASTSVLKVSTQLLSLHENISLLDDVLSPTTPYSLVRGPNGRMTFRPVSLCCWTWSCL